ncbi:MAG: glycosyl transferase group 1, partial [Firmicutes bacterium]|nr:glycosyl transferase group 1 [Bacillota bacterium]
MQKLILNLSMLGPKPTGLGVYSEHSANALASHFQVGLIAGQSALPPGDLLIKAPESIAIGGGKLAAIRRQLWMRSLSFDAGSLVYSPTHHGLPGIRDQIITIHDLICLRFPSQHKPQYLFFKFGLPR